MKLRLCLNIIMNGAVRNEDSILLFLNFRMEQDNFFIPPKSEGKKYWNEIHTIPFHSAEIGGEEILEWIPCHSVSFRSIRF